MPLTPPQISPCACFSASCRTYRLNFSNLLSLGLILETPTPSLIWPPTALGSRVELMGGWASYGGGGARFEDELEEMSCERAIGWSGVSITFSFRVDGHSGSRGPYSLAL